MPTAYLVPKAGLRVRDPETLQVLPPEGAQIRLNAYWRRRINDGDVSVGKARTPAPASTPSDKAKSAKPAASRGAQE